jgi:hypothetical protein
MVEVLAAGVAEDLIYYELPILLAPKHQALLQHIGRELVITHAHHAPVN